MEKIQNNQWIQKKQKGKEKQQIKKDEFPALAPAPIQKKSTMDFKELFARRKEIKKRQKKMKYGWIRITKNGIIDSLSPEEREYENTERNERKMEHAMIELAYRIDRDTEKRIEYEDVEPVILQEYSSEEEYISSEESYVDEDEEGYESI
jgi:hypothetical protein